jgi:hypothetical protein
MLDLIEVTQHPHFLKMAHWIEVFSLDAYYDIKLYPSFHNQWAVPQYIVMARWPQKHQLV